MRTFGWWLNVPPPTDPTFRSSTGTATPAMAAPATESAPRRKREPGLFISLVLLMLCMIAGKYVLPSGRASAIPGPKRGDMVLDAGSLPEELAGWKKVNFTPAADPTEVADRESWWVHAWNYTNGPCTAFVSVDQAQWVAWHELSASYVANGWELADRHVYEVDDPRGGVWHLVVVDFRKGNFDRGMLCFSLFGSDGTAMEAFYDGKPFERLNLDSGGADAAKTPVPARRWQRQEFERVIQAQVFYAWSGEISEDLRRDLIRLHLASREVFRQRWDEHWKKLRG